MKPLLCEEDRPAIGRLLVDTESIKCRSSSRLGGKKSKIENIMLGTRTSPMPGKHRVIIHNLWGKKISEYLTKALVSKQEEYAV